MDDIHFVQVLKAEHHACEEEADVVLLEPAHLSEVEPEVASGTIVEDQVKMVAVLEGILHVHQKRVLQLW